MDYEKLNNLPLVVIFGRTNVGKSTLFNCLTEKKQALISDIEGTTRDSNIGVVEWREKKFALVDTGGITDFSFFLKRKKNSGSIEEEVQKQAINYLKKADLILFLVDKKEGLLPQDKEIAIFLKKISPELANIILAVNKVDGQRDRKDLFDFYKLGLGEPIGISAASGSATGDLLDLVINKIKAVKKKKVKDENENEKIKEEVIKVSILGQPNVGKSSLLNSILGEKRVIVSPIPHTTREPQNTFLEYNNRKIKLIDTAGISKKGMQFSRGKKDLYLEKKGIAMSLASLKKSDMVLLVIDISRSITQQDLKIIEEAITKKKSLIIIANKWDLIPVKDFKKYTAYIRAKIPFAAWAPIQFISAATGAKVNKILDLILEISEQRKKELSEEDLKKFIKQAIKIHQPSRGKGVKHPRIRSFKQISSNPPSFELMIGGKEDLHFSYLRFLENRLREQFYITGTPLSIYIKKSRPLYSSSKFSKL
jgi:GTP-binding protein